MSSTDRLFTGIGTGTSIGDALDSHAAMLALIPNDSRVLEVGCGTGEMAQAQALGQLAVLEREVRRLNEECRALAEDAGRRVADVTARIEDIERARTWRVFEPYRRLRVRLRGTD